MPGHDAGQRGRAAPEQGLGRDGIDVHSYGFVDDCDSRGRRHRRVRGRLPWWACPARWCGWPARRPGRRIGRGRIKSVLLSGDHVTPAMRAAIEQAWDCRVFEHYGSTEVGLGGAVQCRAHAGLHVREADLLFEVIDPATGQTLPDGAEGELVVTTLTRRGMPLIRFRTGDLVRMAAEPCACGSVLRCVERVIGRKDERVGSGGGRACSPSPIWTRPSTRWTRCWASSRRLEPGAGGRPPHRRGRGAETGRRAEPSLAEVGAPSGGPAAPCGVRGWRSGRRCRRSRRDRWRRRPSSGSWT